MRPLALIVLWMLGTASIGVAQARAEDTRLVQTTPGNCEMNAAALDSVRSEALEEANKARVVIVIARLGTRERSAMQNRRRLQIVKTYLSKYGLESQRIVAAEGERVAGYGRVEFYVAGKLRVVLLANRNKPMCVECCDPDDADFYPYRRAKEKTTIVASFHGPQNPPPLSAMAELESVVHLTSQPDFPANRELGVPTS